MNRDILPYNPGEVVDPTVAGNLSNGALKEQARAGSRAASTEIRHRGTEAMRRVGGLDGTRPTRGVHPVRRTA